MDNLWAIGPTVFREGKWENVCYDHDHPVLHRAAIQQIGGIGEGNAGEFLVETPCGYTGWAKTLNRNPDGVPACEACLNGRMSAWVRMTLPITTTDVVPDPLEPDWGTLQREDFSDSDDA